MTNIVQQLSLFDLQETKAKKESNENYTPKSTIELAHQFYGYPNLDPFTCELANLTVKAEQIFTIEDDGMIQDWRGYPTIWINPPYSAGFLEPVVDKMIELLSTETPEILLLTNTDHSTKWYKKALRRCDRFCLSDTRLAFYSPTREAEGKKHNGNNRPQTLFYYGQNPKRFKEVFEGWGMVCRTD